MNDYFKLTEEQQRMVITQTANKIGLPVQAVEKDLWVTVILQVLFTLSFADKLVFKDGSSLSKVWNLIQRFSEDIDLVIDRSIFNSEGDLTKKQLKRLRKESSLFVRDTVVPALKQALKLYGLSELCIVEAEPDGDGDNTYPEPRKIHIRYKSLFEERQSYLAPEVMLEIGSRALMEPAETAKVKSMISTNFPINTTIVNSDILTAVPQKTFLEKAFLLHELFSTDGGAIANRKSRHLYDLEKMMDSEFALKAITDDELWNTIHHHREVFTHMKDVDYSPDIRDRISLVPPQNVIEEWRKDYEVMQTAMIYGESLTFDELAKRMEALTSRFRLRTKE
ncbi:MAG: nucleotidyl transferase AbiEii/AbiGii toxin family protein [Bacteroides sp.]|nr:nucleotidyl transferase AbiEii/AbiGii toxin family protein [Bacteroides sp.]